MIKGIIFDKDGTLFDFNATWGAWARQMLAEETGGDPLLFARLAEALGYDAAAGRFEAGSIVIAATVAEVADVFQSVLPALDRDALLDRMNAASAMVAQVEAVPLRPYFAGLHGSGLRLGIATNDAEAPARQHLLRAEVAHFFDFIAGYDSGFGAKPATGQLLAFCDRVALDPAHCLMVGDSTHDLHAGRAAGMRTVGVLTGPALQDDLAPLADVVLAHIGQIPAWLAAENLLAS
ncbi:HAD family hydrolase [Yoonia sp.]|uniref:HAD family hydrolase n=1 Tax=Yoonia sp. TaxID=2212373 RepID=UPI002FD9D1E5